MTWSLTHPLSFHALHDPDGVATSVEGRRRSWAQLHDRVASLAAGLVGLGVAPGDRVAILADNSDSHWEAVLAVWWAGAAVNPVNIRWSPREMAFSLDDCDTRVLMVASAYAYHVPELQRRSTSLKIVIAMDGGDETGSLTLEGLIAKYRPIADAGRAGDDLAGIFYTGGTTGFPKGVSLSQHAIASNTLINLLEMPLGPEDVVLTVAPMFHLGGLCIVLRALFRGAACVFVRSFDEKVFLETAQREGATYTLLVPVMIQRLLDSGEDVTLALDRLRLVQYGASPISETVLRRFVEALPNVDLIQSYGMTEMSGPFTILPAYLHRPIAGEPDPRLRSAGRAAIGIELRILREDGSPAPVDEVGEIVIRGPNVMSGYWNQPELTNGALRDGWMHSGDMGHLDSGGYVFIVDRLKDMIVTGGENVYSSEVEDALSSHTAVADCAVIGIPSERWGEQIHAVVVLRSGERVEEGELRAHCKSLIANYKCPVSFEFCDALPYTGTGKLQKNVLRESFWAGRSRRVS